MPCLIERKSLSTATKQQPYMNESMQLRRDHAYYTQVQSQMAATQLSRAYFVVFTGCTLTTEVIYFDENFWATIRPKAEDFFFNHIFPELQTMSILKQFQHATRTCICQGAKSGRVVSCSECRATFHLKCVKLKRTPASWVCTKCQTDSQSSDE